MKRIFLWTILLVGFFLFSPQSSFATGNYAVSFSPILRPSTDSATLEMWLKLSQTQGLTSLVTKEFPYQEGLIMNISSNGKLEAAARTNSTPFCILDGNTTVPGDNQWHHVAVVKSPSMLYVFLDGHEDATPMSCPGSLVWSTTSWSIGGSIYYHDRYLTNGIVDEIRFSSIARYINNFTPSATLFSSDSSTIFLYHLDEGSGPNVSDSSSNMITGNVINGTWVTGNISISSKYAISLAGNGYIFIPSNGYIDIPDSPILRPSTDSATLEMWLKLSQTQGLTSLVTKEVPNQEGIIMNISPNGTLEAAVRTNTSPFCILDGNTVLPGDNQWHHVAIVKNSSLLHIFLDGHEDATPMSCPGSLVWSTSDWSIGGSIYYSNRYLSGSLDEIRISNSARYFGNFTPLNSEFVSDANTLLLYHLDEGSGTSLTDSSSNTIVAHIVGRADWVAGAPFNSPPIVGAITAPNSPQLINTTISASAPFTDADLLDTHTAVWDWGDGSTSSGTLTESNGTGSVSNTHTYAQAGVYTVTLTVTDNHGLSGSNVFQYVVVYNPAGGFVTAGGFFDSPTGSYTANPSASGRTRIGVNAKYINGVLQGSLKLNFKNGNLDFISSGSDWLVVTNGNTAQYQGTGTINGIGSYTFQATVVDNSATNTAGTVQVKIFNGTTVIYDSQVQPLGGGFATVHP